MPRRLSAAITAILIGASGCGSGNGPGPVTDNAPPFVGSWYGYGTETDTFQDGSASTRSLGFQLLVAASGKNALDFPGFCAPGDLGPDATVTGAGQFSMKNHVCPPTGSCGAITTIESGTGTLSGSSLTLAFGGHVRQAASSGCAASTVGFQVSMTATHDPSGLQPPPVTPQNLTVTPYQNDYGGYVLQWDPLDDAGSGLTFELQVKLGADDWEPLSLDASPGSTMAEVGVGTVPERTELGFRLRTIRGPVSSDFSNEVFINSGFYSPGSIGTTLLHGGLEMTWLPRTDVAAMVIARADASQPDSFTPLATVSPTAGHFIDTTTAERADYVYHLYWADGAVTGRWSEVIASGPVLSPTGLTGVANGDRVDLAWTNHSVVATEVVVLRADGAGDVIPTDAVAYLPPTASAYSDLSVPPGPHTYRVEARAPFGSFGGMNVFVVTPPESSAGTWSTELVEVPSLVNQAVLDSQDRLVTLSGNFGTLDRSDHPSWAPYSLPPGLSGKPFFALDAAGGIHLVSSQQVSSAPLTWAMTHWWVDADVWQSEEVTRGSGDDSTFLIDETGHLLVAIDGGGPSSVRVYRWTPGGYVGEDPQVALPQGFEMSGVWLARSADGATHLVAQGSGTTAHSWRQGTWSAETVNLAAGSIYTPGTPALTGLFAPGGRALDLVTYDFSTGAVALRRLDASGLGPAQTILSAVPNSAAPFQAITADGTDRALLVNTVEGTTFAQDSDGWAPHLLMGYGAAVLGFGFDPANHLTVVALTGPAIDGNLRAVIYRRQ